jgi:hypothetical protein
MDEETWCSTATDDQFWSLQYSEHLEMIKPILLAVPLPDFHRECNRLTKRWEELYNELLSDENIKLSNVDLEKLHDFKLRVLTTLMTSDKWPGWAPMSLYDHMIREVEFLEKPKDGRQIISMWLTDMFGHASLGVAWIDPAHTDLIKRGKKFCESFEKIKLSLGQDPYLNLNQLFGRLEEQEGKIQEWIDYEIPPDTNLKAVVNQLLPVQRQLAEFHIELRNLMKRGAVFTNMTETYINHTVRETLRALYEFELLSKGQMIQ